MIELELVKPPPSPPVEFTTLPKQMPPYVNKSRRKGHITGLYLACYNMINISN
jgi:hypothetical protein